MQLAFFVNGYTNLASNSVKVLFNPDVGPNFVFVSAYNTINMKIRILYFILFLGMSSAAFSQAGIRLYTGVSGINNLDPVISPQGTTQLGYHFGGDARLNGGGMFFVLGLRFTAVNTVPEESPSFIPSSDLEQTQILGFRVGLGFVLARINEKIAIRSKLLGSFDNVWNEPTFGVPGITRNAGSLSANTGLGLDYGILSVDFDYGVDLLNRYYQMKDSRATAWSLSIGILL